MNDAERDHLVDNIVGHLLDGVSEPVLHRAFDYWRNVDTDLGRPHREACAVKLIQVDRGSLDTAAATPPMR